MVFPGYITAPPSFLSAPACKQVSWERGTKEKALSQTFLFLSLPYPAEQAMVGSAVASFRSWPCCTVQCGECKLCGNREGGTPPGLYWWTQTAIPLSKYSPIYIRASSLSLFSTNSQGPQRAGASRPGADGPALQRPSECERTCNFPHSKFKFTFETINKTGDRPDEPVPPRRRPPGGGEGPLPPLLRPPGQGREVLLLVEEAEAQVRKCILF